MTTIKLKNGSGAPAGGDLVQGEPALDLTNKRLYTEDSGGTVIEVGTNPGVDVTFADNRKAVFGAGSDLQIYHDGSHSKIEDAGTGDLKFITNGSGFNFQKGSTENLANFAIDGAVSLYYDNSLKLATTSTGIDVTGTVTVSDGSTSAPSITNAGDSNSGIYFPADDNIGLVVGGSRKLLANSSGVSINNGVLDADGGITVDNITIDGNEIDVSSGDLTLDVAGNIILDVDGGEVKFDDGGTRFANLYKSSNNFVVSSAISDGDILFKGNDGGSTITALTLDMSAAGAATFNSDVGIGATPNTYSGYTTLTLGSSSNGGLIDFERNGTIKGEIFTEAAIFGFQTIQADDDIVFRGNDGGSTITALTLDMSNAGAATFNAGVTIGGEVVLADSGTPKFAIGNSSNDFYIYSNAAGSERMRIDSSGNLLVGKTSSDLGATAGIELNGQYDVGYFTRSAEKALVVSRLTNDGTLMDFRKDGTTVGSIGVSGGNNLYISGQETSHAGLTFATQSVLPTTQGAINNNTVDLGQSGNAFKDLYLSGNSNVGNYVYFGGGTNYYVHSDNNYYLRFGTAGNERARIDSSGNLLVGKTGTSVADTGVQWLPNGNSAITRSGGVALFLNRTSSDGSIVDFRKDNTTVGNISSVGGADLKVVLSGDEDQYITGNSAANYMSFSSANQERMRIDSSGNLLVGCTSGGAKVVTEAVPTGTAYLAKWSATGGSALYLEVGGSAVGTITCTASATAYNTSSDQRLKDNIVDAPSASDDIDAIQVRSFDWKADGSHQKYGMVAQELNTVAPEAVSTPEDSEEMMGVDYSKLVTMLVKEIQSLRARVAQLETN
jgi:hypothetical protein